MEINKTQRYIFEKGEIIMFSEGEYSSYHCKNIFQVLKTFDIRTVMKNCKCNKYEKRYPWDRTSSECKYCYNDEDTRFCIKKLAEAEANGFIKELNYVEIWEDPFEEDDECVMIEKPEKWNPDFIRGGTIKERSR